MGSTFDRNSLNQRFQVSASLSRLGLGTRGTMNALLTAVNTKVGSLSSLRVASTTDNGVPRFNGTTGAMQTSPGLTVGDSGSLIAAGGARLGTSSGAVLLGRSAGTVGFFGATPVAYKIMAAPTAPVSLRAAVPASVTGPSAARFIATLIYDLRSFGIYKTS